MHPSSYGRSVLAPASLAGVDPIFTSLNLRTILSPATHAPNTIALIRHLSVMPFLVGLGFALPQQARQTHRPNRVPCVRTGLPPRAALHPALRRRSCIWLQARDVGLEGLTPSGCVRSMAHWGGLPWPPGTVSFCRPKRANQWVVTTAPPAMKVEGASCYLAPSPPEPDWRISRIRLSV